MKIFVTGATGFVGRYLVKQLAKKYKVIALVRNKNKIKLLPKKNIKIVMGDLFSCDVLKKEMKGIDVVMHLAAVIREIAKGDRWFWDNNVKGTENVVKAACMNKVKQFIYCSSVAVYGKVKDKSKFIKEDYPCYGQNIYGKTKYEGELVTKKYCKKYKIPYTILRPGRIFGLGDIGATFLIYKLVKKGFFPMLGGGKSTMMPIYVEDLSKAFMKCIKNKKSYNKIYNVAGKDVMTKKEFIYLIAKKLNVKFLSLYAPIKSTLFVAKIIEFFFKLFNKEPPVSRKRLKFFILSRKYDLSSAKEDLNWEPKKDMEKGVEEMVVWYKKQGYL